MNTKIMVVDDEPDIRTAVSTVLELSGFEVVTVENGNRCIEELEKGFRGVILMDVMMPELNGWDTIKELVSRGLMDGNIISMLTAKEDPDVELMELTEVVLNYIRKPFKADYLVSMVTKYCEWLEQSKNAGIAG